MTRGRRPQPAAIKRAKGNPGRRPIAEPVEQPAEVAVAPPAQAPAGRSPAVPPAWLDTAAEGSEQAREMSRLARAMWDKLQPVAAALNLVKDSDINAFARYCRYCAEWIFHTRTIDREGATYVTSSEHVETLIRPHPAVRFRKDVEHALKELEDRLGFTPAARLRLYQALAAQPPELKELPVGGRADEPAEEAPSPPPAPSDAGESPIGFLGKLH